MLLTYYNIYLLCTILLINAFRCIYNIFRVSRSITYEIIGAEVRVNKKINGCKMKRCGYKEEVWLY